MVCTTNTTDNKTVEDHHLCHSMDKHKVTGKLFKKFVSPTITACFPYSFHIIINFLMKMSCCGVSKWTSYCKIQLSPFHLCSISFILTETSWHLKKSGQQKNIHGLNWNTVTEICLNSYKCIVVVTGMCLNSYKCIVVVTGIWLQSVLLYFFMFSKIIMHTNFLQDVKHVISR
jgi:hypothetical protein